jgi:tRNA/tmRNA/rRNA uracil-C5-methylase (TrmA/RlmC/RlmD family)
MVPPEPPRGREAQPVEIRIERLAAGGDGVGRLPDGRAVFVPFTAPGDRVLARPVEERRRYARADPVQVIEPSPQRVEPPCPVFGECGGCTWQHIGYPHQVEAKRRILRDALERIAGLSLPDRLAFEPSPRPYGYRQRARLLVERGRLGYRRRRSHRPCPIEGCPILAPPLEEWIASFAGGPAGRGTGEIEITAGADSVVRAAHLSRARPQERIEIRAGGERLGFSPGVFVQANALLLDALVAAVCSAAGPEDGGDALLELHAGAGLFTLPLARRFRRVMAVERDTRAAADLRANLRGAGLTNVEVERASVEEALACGLPALPDVVLLDPPRAGLTAQAAEALGALGARRIVYLSCDPATLARDAARLCASGYALAAVEGFDLFPQTPHVEALVVLVRRAGERPSPAAPCGDRPAPAG